METMWKESRIDVQKEKNDCNAFYDWSWFCGHRQKYLSKQERRTQLFYQYVWIWKPVKSK